MHGPQALALVILLSLGGGLEAQAVRSPGQPGLEEPADSSDILGAARRAQATFERHRMRWLPLARGSYGGRCDENVGRFCSWYEEGNWDPEPEASEIEVRRLELLRVLDSLGTELPGDGWILGQRVWYRVEAGRPDEALTVAQACGGVEAWWCSALQGLALHELGRYVASLSAYERALAMMGRDEARRWRVPRWPVDGEARRRLEGAPPDSLHGALTRLWALADPLFLVPGNDRLTAHYARWTLAEIRRRARNPFQIPWGQDMAQLTVRHGWALGWERDWSRDVYARDNVVGHKHPEGRDFMPAGRALEDPSGARAEDLRADRSRPRSLYAPAYAPLLLPAEGQVAAFPRGGDLVVVASQYLPEDTTYAATQDRRRPWLEAGDQAGRAEEAGLFLVAESGAMVRRRRVRGEESGALMVHAPAGRYVVSVEHWSPARRRAGRHRVGLRRDTVPPDVATLSDILLLRGGGVDPGSVEGALERVLPRAEIRPGEPLGIVFEVGGLGWRAETLSFELSVERRNRGVLRRAGELLGLVGRQRPLSLGWEEQGPRRPEPHFRWLTLDLPEITPGAYEVQLEVRVAGRGALTAAQPFVVVGSPWAEGGTR
jgi:hypothetical protein